MIREMSLLRNQKSTSLFLPLVSPLPKLLKVAWPYKRVEHTSVYGQNP